MSTTTPTPDVSVIIPAHGRPEELGRCLEHLAAQSVATIGFEVVIVDDGSPDSLEATVMSSRHRLRLRFLRHECNRGRAAARNTGAAAAHGRLLIFLDADMLASPGWLQAHHQAHVAAAETGPIVGLGPIPVEPAYLGLLGEYMQRRGHMRPGIDADEVPYRYFVSSNTSVARELFESVGGYDDAFVYYGGEDIDLGYRLHRAGGRVVVVRPAPAHHAYRYELGSAARRMREFGRLTLPLVFERHPELRRDFRLDLLESRGAYTAACLRAATHPLLLSAGGALAPVLGRVFPWVLSYLLVGNYFRGYVEHMRAATPAGGV